jgi:NAD+ synthetase
MLARDKYRVCVDALKEYADNAGFTDVVIGLSGGMDSSLVAVMSVDAFGADHVHGVLLPGPFSSASSVDDALALAENLGIETKTVSICQPYEAFEKAMVKACGGDLSGTAAENTQARCRMVVLMGISNTFNWMLVNTGNKSEAQMGYSTLYGDTAGAFAPIGGLYKSDVYAVAYACNDIFEAAGKTAPIPENVFVKAPSAELSAGQEDEKSLGVDYATLDKALIALFEQGKDVAGACEASGLPESEVQRIKKTAEGYAFKRAMEPPFPATRFYD